jgi:O-antigen/teichoic acid export membrane protein
MATPTEEGLRGKVFKGLAWKAVSQVVLQLSRLLTIVILARLLDPRDYGLAGMVLVISSLVQIFSDLALGSALVQRKLISEQDRSTVYWTTAATGLLFTFIGVGLSWPVASFYGEPAVQPLFAVFSLSFFITALSSTQAALLTRDMNFRSLELRQMISYAVGAVVGVVTAALGYGAWAIILQQLTLAATSTVLLTLLTRWRPRLIFSLTSLRNLGGFGLNVFGTRLLFYANRNADNILIGRYLGPAALGLYALAYNVMLVPFSQIASPIQEVLFPAFSKVQDDVSKIASAWIRVNRVVGAISIPSLAGLIVVAPDFVAVVLGSRWSAVTPVIQILCWVGILQSLQRLNSSILEARNKTGVLLRYSIIALVASLAGFVGGLHWGVVGVAAGYAVSSTVVEPYYTWLTGRELGMSLLQFFSALRGVFEAALLMMAAVFAVRLALISAGVPDLPRLLLCILTGIVVFVPACAWRSPETVAEVRALIPRRRRARATAPARPSET